MGDNKTTPASQSSNGNGGIPWKFITYLGMILVPLGSMITYFFISQAWQDAAHAGTRQKIERVEAIQESHTKVIEELKAQSAANQQHVQKIQTQIGKIDTNQSLTREFLEKQLAEIKGDLKDIKKSGGP